MASSSKQAPATAERPRDGEFDPVYEWLDDGDSYLLRLNLPGFKTEDFRVHVHAAGRLTVISQGAGRAPRLHKAFQLPNTANLDGITGRFDGSVLTLTVPKLHQPGAPVAPPPTETKEEQGATDEPKGQQQQQEKPAAPPKVGPGHADAAAERASMPVRGKGKEDDKTKAELAAPPLPGKKKNDGVRPREQDEKSAAADDHRAYATREAARRIEAARAKVAEAKAAAERTGGQWKERVASEGLKLAETIGKNKEIVATAVAAFTLGVFVSQAFSRR